MCACAWSKKKKENSDCVCKILNYTCISNMLQPAEAFSNTNENPVLTVKMSPVIVSNFTNT